MTTQDFSRYAVRRLKAWVEATYPDEIHTTEHSIGYYAASNAHGPHSDQWGDNEVHAQLRYYGGYGSTQRVAAKVAAAQPLLDALGVTYELSTNEYGYSCLCVACDKLPAEESASQM